MIVWCSEKEAEEKSFLLVGVMQNSRAFPFGKSQKKLVVSFLIVLCESQTLLLD